ncbi:NmrA family NAD(P)-binding protein [Leifsonia aquatica]
MTDRPVTVLVVGATGSIGTHAVAEALRQGYRVRALARDTITVR